MNIFIVFQRLLSSRTLRLWSSTYINYELHLIWFLHGELNGSIIFLSVNVTSYFISSSNTIFKFHLSKKINGTNNTIMNRVCGNFRYRWINTARVIRRSARHFTWWSSRHICLTRSACKMMLSISSDVISVYIPVKQICGNINRFLTTTTGYLKSYGIVLVRGQWWRWRNKLTHSSNILNQKQDQRC